MKLYKGIVGKNEAKLIIKEYEADAVEVRNYIIYRYHDRYHDGKALDFPRKVLQRDIDCERYNKLAESFYFFSFDKEKVAAWVEKKRAKRAEEIEELLCQLKEAEVSYELIQ